MVSSTRQRKQQQQLLLVDAVILALQREINATPFEFNSLALLLVTELHDKLGLGGKRFSINHHRVARHDYKDAAGVIGLLQHNKSSSPKIMASTIERVRDMVSQPAVVNEEVVHSAAYREFAADEQHVVNQIKNSPSEDPGMMESISKFVKRWSSAPWVWQAGARGALLSSLVGILAYKYEWTGTDFRNFAMRGVAGFLFSSVLRDVIDQIKRYDPLDLEERARVVERRRVQWEREKEGRQH